MSITEKSEKGRRGEETAARFLTEKGYEIIGRNYRAGRAEIDLIAQKDRLTVFVEVKSRSTAQFGFPEEAVSPAQQARIVAAAETYIFENDLQTGIRFDIIGILQARHRPAEIVHFEDAFY